MLKILSFTNVISQINVTRNKLNKFDYLLRVNTSLNHKTVKAFVMRKKNKFNVTHFGTINSITPSPTIIYSNTSCCIFCTKICESFGLILSFLILISIIGTI